VNAQYFTGDARAAVEPTREVIAEARALAYPPLELRALALLADLQDTLGELGPAEATLGEALRAAAAAHDDRAFGVDMIKLVAVVGVRQNRFAEAELAARITESVLVRAGSPDEDLAGLYSVRGQLAHSQGRLYEARAHQLRAIALDDAAPGATAGERAGERTNLAATLLDLGEYTEALAQLGEARTLFEEELGTTHPAIATLLLNSGTAYVGRGELDEAIAAYRAAIAIWERAYGPDYVMVGDCLENVAVTEHKAGNDEAARRDVERGIDVLERALGEDHLELAWARGNYGEILCALGEHDRAMAQFERALAIAELSLGPDHPDLFYPLSGRADCELRRGASATAIPLLERALRVLANGEGPLVQAHIDEYRALLERARVNP
jgi:tetratricopeptide (TPR) repeat protein